MDSISSHTHTQTRTHTQTHTCTRTHHRGSVAEEDSCRDEGHKQQESNRSGLHGTSCHVTSAYGQTKITPSHTHIHSMSSVDVTLLYRTHWCPDCPRTPTLSLHHGPGGRHYGLSGNALMAPFLYPNNQMFLMTPFNSQVTVITVTVIVPCSINKHGVA